jgi:hypothetical protein
VLGSPQYQRTHRLYAAQEQRKQKQEEAARLAREALQRQQCTPQQLCQQAYDELNERCVLGPARRQQHIAELQALQARVAQELAELGFGGLLPAEQENRPGAGNSTPGQQAAAAAAVRQEALMGKPLLPVQLDPTEQRLDQPRRKRKYSMANRQTGRVK